MKFWISNETIDTILNTVRKAGGNVAGPDGMQIYDMEFDKLAVTNVTEGSDTLWGFTLNKDSELHLLGTPTQLALEDGESHVKGDVENIMNMLLAWTSIGEFQMPLSNREFRTLFNKAYNKINSIDFDASWKNGTGYLDGAVKIKTMEAVSFIDDYDRKAIVIPLMYKDLVDEGNNLVIFERFSPNENDRQDIFVHNARPEPALKSFTGTANHNPVICWLLHKLAWG